MRTEQVGAGGYYSSRFRQCYSYTDRSCAGTR